MDAPERVALGLFTISSRGNRLWDAAGRFFASSIKLFIYVGGIVSMHKYYYYVLWLTGAVRN